MKIENGKIVEAAESELFDRWLSCDHCEIYPFPYYKWLCQEKGMKIVDEEGEVMDGLDKTNCAFALDGICKLDEKACKRCKVDLETSEFHKTIIVGGLSWEDVVKMQQPKDKKAR